MGETSEKEMWASGAAKRRRAGGFYRRALPRGLTIPRPRWPFARRFRSLRPPGRCGSIGARTRCQQLTRRRTALTARQRGSLLFVPPTTFPWQSRQRRCLSRLRPPRPVPAAPGTWRPAALTKAGRVAGAAAPLPK